MLHGHHYQNAYITRDIETAIARMSLQAERTDIRSFQIEMPVITPRGSGVGVLKLALFWVDDLQYEFIEPVSGLVDLYAEQLPADDSLRFHHVAARVDDWNAFRAQVARDGMIVAQEGGNELLRFLYVDMRDLLGHYVEYVWATPERWAGMGTPWATKPAR